MDQSTNLEFYSPTSGGVRNNYLYTLKDSSLKFSGLSSVYTARSLNDSRGIPLINFKANKAKDQGNKKEGEDKPSNIKSQMVNPEAQISFDQNCVKTRRARKSQMGFDRPKFEFRCPQTNKKQDNHKKNSINNFLQLYLKGKQQLKNNIPKNDLGNQSPPETLLERQSRSLKQKSEQLMSKYHSLGTKNNMEEEEEAPRVRVRASTFQIPVKYVSLGDFAVGRRLGKGKFGQVYLAKHKKIGFLVAMKIISLDIIRSKNLQSQITRQIMLQLYLQHPNIVQMYGLFSQNNNLYLLLQPCLDGHLLSQLKQRRRFQEHEASGIVMQILDGVQTMHKCSIMHRDIKPQNIVRHEGVSKIADLGWAVYSPNALRETFCGTPLYMSPELLGGQQYRQSVDIWAVGILTYELLIGRLPFKVQHYEQLNKIITDEIQFPQHISISQQAKDFILSILKKNPEDRCDIEVLFSHPFLNKRQ